MFPTALLSLAKYVGIGIPFAFALLTYKVSIWLDKISSPAEKRNISKWLQGGEINGDAASVFVLSVFDYIYTTPLLHWRAFLRSAFFTCVVTAIVGLQVFPLQTYIFSLNMMTGLMGTTALWLLAVEQLLGWLVFNIFCDYISLLIIKRLIGRGSTYSILMLFLTPIIGASLIFIAFMIRDFVFSGFRFNFRDPFAAITNFVLFDTFSLSDRTDWLTFFYGAILVQLWLPILGTSLLVLKLVMRLRAVVGYAQLFLRKDRDNNVIKAIGLVATAIVFIVSSIVIIIYSRPN